MPTSTAAVLTARFPYVTPPGRLNKSSRIESDKRLFSRLTRIELVDGGFWDNSGMVAASSLVDTLSATMAKAEARVLRAERQKVAGLPQQVEQPLLAGPTLSDIEFHIISFTHAGIYMNSPASPSSSSELFLPITVFDRVRVSRLSELGELKNAHVKATHAIDLFDQNFDAPLSWVLSGFTKHSIEVRAGLTKSAGEYDKICCLVRVTTPGPAGEEVAETITPIPRGQVEQFRQQLAAPGAITQGDWTYSVSSEARVEALPYLPNTKAFEEILTVIRGDSAGPTTSSTNAMPTHPAQGPPPAP